MSKAQKPVSMESPSYFLRFASMRWRDIVDSLSVSNACVKDVIEGKAHVPLFDFISSSSFSNSINLGVHEDNDQRNDSPSLKFVSKMLSRMVIFAWTYIYSALNVVGQTTRMCSDIGLCFETAKLDVMGSIMTVGFALPPFETNEGEVLVSTSIPVPYGFVAFNTGYDAENSTEVNITKDTVVMAPFTDEINQVDANPPPLNLSEVRVQVSVIGDSDQLLPMNGTNARTTVSQISRRKPSAVDLLFRFRSPQLLAANQLRLVQPGLTKIIGAFSMNAPEYLDAAEEQAVLYLNGSQVFEFVLNSTAAVYQNYTAMLEVAGVD